MVLLTVGAVTLTTARVLVRHHLLIMVPRLGLSLTIVLLWGNCLLALLILLLLTLVNGTIVIIVTLWLGGGDAVIDGLALLVA